MTAFRSRLTCWLSRLRPLQERLAAQWRCCRVNLEARSRLGLPAETRQFLSHNGVVRVQKIAPGRVPKLGCALGGRGDIEEEHGGQDTIGGIDWALARNEFLNI